LILQMISKVTTYEKIKPLFFDGMKLLYGGFGGVGTPPGLVDCLIESGAKGVHLIGNDAGFPDVGMGKFIVLGRASSLIASHIGSNPVAGEQMTSGKLQVEFLPQGIFVERIRCGGVGIHGFLSDVSQGTPLAQGKKIIQMDGKDLLYQPAIRGDISLVYAKKADYYGNLVFDKTARNTNPLVAMAGKITIVEADEIVPAGSIDPEQVMLPGIFVQHIVPSKGYNWKWIWETQE
jgi:acetate CoA/acetoacetate CoA-transferase alpha subunit